MSGRLLSGTTLCQYVPVRYNIVSVRTCQVQHCVSTYLSGTTLCRYVPVRYNIVSVRTCHVQHCVSTYLSGTTLCQYIPVRYNIVSVRTCQVQHRVSTYLSGTTLRQYVPVRYNIASVRTCQVQHCISTYLSGTTLCQFVPVRYNIVSVRTCQVQHCVSTYLSGTTLCQFIPARYNIVSVRTCQVQHCVSTYLSGTTLCLYVPADWVSGQRLHLSWVGSVDRLLRSVSAWLQRPAPLCNSQSMCDKCVEDRLLFHCVISTREVINQFFWKLLFGTWENCERPLPCHKCRYQQLLGPVHRNNSTCHILCNLSGDIFSDIVLILYDFGILLHINFIYKYSFKLYWLNTKWVFQKTKKIYILHFTLKHFI